METVGNAFWALSLDMGVYILFGLLAAGVLHQLIREEWIRKHLGASNNRSVFKAALYGTPLPLCSCSVIPFAASLRQNGASKGSTLTFLISTPITGVDSILATFGMFGWAFTLYRIGSSVIMAIAAGIIINFFEPKEVKKSFTFSTTAPIFSLKTPKAPTVSSRKPFSVLEVFRYGFITLLGSFSKPLFWGLLIGAFITVAIPSNLHELFGENRLLGYIIAVSIATPMYVCATASLPIAASLIISGVSPGAAFVFLSAGPATNTVTMGVVKSILGMRSLVVYLSVIAIGSVMFGALIDLGFDSLDVRMNVDLNEHHGILEQISAGILLALIAYHTVRGWFTKKGSSCSGGSCCS
ncbi:SO_0444 family Cu/Zn efflux transporter [Sulfuricurvum sp.]|uniref:SO_0444 family Cu/Zn efflux transporter n=1 Tax=Sulfuricurvum sp. TaxID=2025608 RepID=UPI0019A4959F|nr:SO_0444 family Cu/Zn efflux transporter [Sulfuricurvum sp.]MBD3799572.1 SO_0444 family Cu/Zn efflux transporter [Campylobacterota bacterium]MBD3806253.1 SO_0444 family Cu/Zn efflux transporter [Sulfuricurvum sp.]